MKERALCDLHEVSETRTTRLESRTPYFVVEGDKSIERVRDLLEFVFSRLLRLKISTKAEITKDIKDEVFAPLFHVDNL